MIYLAIRLAAQFVSQFPGTIGLGVDSLNLLTDAQMREFIVNGFVTVQTDFPPEFHASVRAQAESIFSTEGNPGNDILPRIPELAELFAHPAVTGALTSVLGPGYAMHAHRHCHLTPTRQPAQRQHQDSYEDDRNVRHHRTRWAMAFYSLQEVPPAMGPTSVLPASQYYTSRSQPERQEESLLCGAAGTVTIVHYDLWHRATTNRSDRNRYMMKFFFCRMSEPTDPSWNCHDPSRRPQFGGAAIPGLCRSVWNWYLGHCRHGTGQTTSAGSVDDARPVGGGNHAVSGSEAGDAGREGKPHLSEADRLQEMYRLSAGTWGKATSDLRPSPLFPIFSPVSTTIPSGCGATPLKPLPGLTVLMAALAAEADTFLDRNLVAQHTNPCQLYAGFGLSAQGAVASEGLNIESLEQTAAIVAAGKHVWYDKPAGDVWAQWQQVVARAQQQNVLIQMGYMLRYHDGFHQIAEWTRSGLLGRVYSLRAHMSTNIPATRRAIINAHRGGIFYELAGHMLDQVIWLLGRPARTASFLRTDDAESGERLEGFVDNTLGVFEFEHAMALVDIAAMETQPMARRFEVYGTAGSAILVEPFEPGSMIRLCLADASHGYAAGEQQIPIRARSRQELYELELEAFLRTIAGEQEPDRSPEHDLLVQETLLRAVGSLVD